MRVVYEPKLIGIIGGMLMALAILLELNAGRIAAKRFPGAAEMWENRIRLIGLTICAIGALLVFI